MNVTEILLNFRDALKALVPMARRAGIPWRVGEAYDEWDLIASSLYTSLVREVIRSSLPTQLRESFDLPKYDLIEADNSDLSTIEVEHPELAHGRWIFHAFGTQSDDFEEVVVRPWATAIDDATTQLESCPVGGAQFRLRLLGCST